MRLSVSHLSQNQVTHVGPIAPQSPIEVSMNRTPWWLSRVVICGFALALAICPVAAQLAPDPSAAVAGIDADVERAMDALHVPGAALGVIVNGKVILAKGYGLREVGKPALVDADTIFDIGSMTKSFTATAVAAMVDDGKLERDRQNPRFMMMIMMNDDDCDFRHIFAFCKDMPYFVFCPCNHQQRKDLT